MNVRSLVACCPEWLRAQSAATDNEGHGPLLGFIDGDWRMGNDLSPVLFCPWCGADKRTPSDLERCAARVVEVAFDSLCEWDDLKAAIAELGNAVDQLKK